EACARGFAPGPWLPIAASDPRIEQLDRGARCVRYRAQTASPRHPWLPTPSPEAFVGGHGRLFLRPSLLPDGAVAKVRFEAPVGVSWSSPWAAGVAGHGFFTSESYVAFGEGLRLTQIEAGGVRISLARLPGTLAVTDEELGSWLGEAVRAVEG